MIGILPAAGKAERFGGLPKFLLPVPDGTLLSTHHHRMVVTGAHTSLIGASRFNAAFIYRDYLPHTAVYLGGDTMSETVLNARPFTQDDDILFGMPDTYFSDDQVYKRLAADIHVGALVSLAVFNVDSEQARTLGMCHIEFESDDTLYVRRIEDKPQVTALRYAWGAMAWKAGFWKYIQPADPHVGYAVQRAIDDGVPVRAYLATGFYHDCANFQQYARLCSLFVEAKA